MIKGGIHCTVTLTKGIGSIVTETIGPFKNLVLDDGLNALAANEFDAWVLYCHVGVGSTPVNPANDGVDQPVASTNNVIDTSLSTKGLPPYYSQRVKTWRFAAGTFNNHQISEVAFTNTAVNELAFSRALVKDTLGNFTSSWIRTDEWLDVTYDFRLYPQFINTDGTLNDGTGTIVIGASAYNYTIRPSNVTTLAYWDASKAIARVMAVSGDYMCGYTSTSTLGLVANQPTTPTGTNATTANSTFANLAYTPQTFYRDITYSLGPDALNSSGGLGAVRFHTGFGAYQMSFSPPLPKWYDSLVFKATLAWGNVDVIA